MITFDELMACKDRNKHTELPKDILDSVKQLMVARPDHRNHSNHSNHTHHKVNNRPSRGRNYKGPINDPRTTAPWLKNKTDEDLLQSHIRSILNRVNDDSYKEFAKELTYENIKTGKDMILLVQLIINKALLESHFCKAYAKLCRELISFKITVTINEDRDDCTEVVSFNAILLEHCQRNFMISISFDKKIEEDDNKLCKAKILGCIGFIGELFNHGVLSGKILMFCFDLINKACIDRKGYSLDAFHKLVETVGSTIKTVKTADNRQMFDYVSDKLEELKNNETFTKKEKFTVLDILDSFSSCE